MAKRKLKDLSGDGKITRKDVLIGRGVLKAKKGGMAKSSAQTSVIKGASVGGSREGSVIKGPKAKGSREGSVIKANRGGSMAVRQRAGNAAGLKANIARKPKGDPTGRGLKGKTLTGGAMQIKRDLGFKKGGSTVNKAGNYTKPGLRKKIFNRIKAQASHGTGAGQWSGRKAQALAKAYKKAGGGYKS